MLSDAEASATIAVADVSRANSFYRDTLGLNQLGRGFETGPILQLLRSEPAVLELNLKLTAGQVLEECRRRGLVVRSERELAGRIASHHWHLRIPGRPGTLELNEWQNRVWVKVHPLRDGGWASALAYELSAKRRA